MIPHFSFAKKTGVRKYLYRIWERWLCVIDPFSGWVLPALWTGLRLCRSYDLNIVIVTVPAFSPLVSATVISKLTGARLIIDYRDPWTNLPARRNQGPIRDRLNRLIERWSIRSASAVVCVTEIMRDDFRAAFRDILPPTVEVVYNGFDRLPVVSAISDNDSCLEMLYAGSFYGSRKLSSIAGVLAEMLASGEINTTNFRFSIYSRLETEDYELIKKLRLSDIIQVNTPVPYEIIKEKMAQADILFLPSGEEFPYAIPFKFYDYLSAGKPILAVSPRGSSVHQMMTDIDCGEWAEFRNKDSIKAALNTVMERREAYTFEGAERFQWEYSAADYWKVITSVLDDGGSAEEADQAVPKSVPKNLTY
jgi:glycosyltransferase involved in cell wall biosynthesis